MISSHLKLTRGGQADRERDLCSTERRHTHHADRHAPPLAATAVPTPRAGVQALLEAAQPDEGGEAGTELPSAVGHRAVGDVLVVRREHLRDRDLREIGRDAVRLGEMR